MNYTKKLIFALPVLILLVILHQAFVIDFRFAKEDFLIKRNYNKNIQHFSDISKDFKAFPRLRIDFAKEDFIDLLLSSQDLFSSHYAKQTDSSSGYFYPDNSWLEVTDTSAILHHEAQQYLCSDFWRVDSSLIVKTRDSIFNISSLWQISYEGYLKTNQLSQVYNSTNLNSVIITKIKNKLISLNCFGYEKNYNDDLIINYRGNGIDFFSYLILGDTIDNTFFDNCYTTYGKISSNLYWYHNERIHVSYTPYLKLRSRKIK